MHQAGLRHGIQCDDLRSMLFRAFQRSQHARMICPGILAEDEDAVGFLEILERHTTFADADAFLQGRAARFMTHVRAVRQVVRSKLTRKELIKKSRFIAGPPASVKGSRVG